MTDTLAPPESRPGLRKAKRRRSRFGTAMFVTLVVALVFVATGVLPVRDFVERENAVNAATEELAEIIAVNEVLSDDVNALYSEEDVERIAREQYGFVRPGEVGYVAVFPEEPETAPAVAEPEIAVHDDRTVLQMMWDFITGNDLTSDG